MGLGDSAVEDDCVSVAVGGETRSVVGSLIVLGELGLVGIGEMEWKGDVALWPNSVKRAGEVG